MENENNFCPLIKNDCRKNSCAWYVPGLRGCATKILAEASDYQADILEELKKVGIDD